MTWRRHGVRCWARRSAGATCAALAAALWLSASPTHAEEEQRRVAVQVVEVAGGRAYLSTGGERQVRVGDQVRIAGAAYPVVAQNSKNIAVALGPRRLERGQRGFVLVHAAATETFRTRAVPRPLAVFAGQWRAPALPAESQTPRFVPLGAMSDARRNRAAFQLDYQRIEPLSGPAAAIGRTRLRALLHAELSGLPVTFDADGFAEFWQAKDLAARPQNASRPVFTLRQLELGYRGDTVQGAIGRLRYASSTLGMLDGARVSANLSDDWAVAAFGGTLANPLDGSLASDASRFGAELAWQDQQAAARPRASLTFDGSQYRGRSDERRILGLVEAYPDFGRLGARAEVSFFDADNPWATATSELTALAADASFRIGSLRLGAALDLRRPERSLWLAAYLPPGYFCVSRPVAGGGATEPCIGTDLRYGGVLNAAWEATSWTLDAGATFTTTRPAVAEQSTGFLHFQRRDLFGALRLDAGASASRGSIIESVALDVGAGLSLGQDSTDVSLYYRPSLARYGADADAFIEHAVGSRLWWALSSVFDLTGSCELVTGRDVDVLLLQLGAAWTPRF